jgi:hypothetical protein
VKEYHKAARIGKAFSRRKPRIQGRININPILAEYLRKESLFTLLTARLRCARRTTMKFIQFLSWQPLAGV